MTLSSISVVVMTCPSVSNTRKIPLLRYLPSNITELKMSVNLFGDGKSQNNDDRTAQ